ERTDVHNAAAPSGQHPAPRFLTHAEPAKDEVAPATLHFLKRDFLRRPENTVTRDVAEKVDAAELRVEPAEQFENLRRVGDIAFVHHRATAQFLYGRGSLAGARLVAVH